MIALLLPLLALAAAPPSAPPPPAAAPVDEARFQRFIAVLPDSASLERETPAPDPAEKARLVALNPGRERDVAAALQAEAVCTAPLSREAVLKMMHAVADRLGPEKLDRMIAFYGSADFKILDRLASPDASGPPSSAAETAEMDRIRAAYPIDDMAAAMDSSGGVIWQDPALAAGFEKCADAREAAFTKAKLRAY
jgi:hypothetical protein